MHIPSALPCSGLLVLLLLGTEANAEPQSAESASKPRQTEFNENNYRPRPIVNRLPPPPPSAEPKRRVAPVKPLTRSAKWSWKNRETVESGTFQWREHNGRIDNASVCMNEKQGSLRYRDCRRGAKVAFAKLCRERSDPAACHARDNYSPLR